MALCTAIIRCPTMSTWRRSTSSAAVDMLLAVNLGRDRGETLVCSAARARSSSSFYSSPQEINAHQQPVQRRHPSSPRSARAPARRRGAARRRAAACPARAAAARASSARRRRPRRAPAGIQTMAPSAKLSDTSSQYAPGRSAPHQRSSALADQRAALVGVLALGARREAVPRPARQRAARARQLARRLDGRCSRRAPARARPRRAAASSRARATFLRSFTLARGEDFLAPRVCVGRRTETFSITRIKMGVQVMAAKIGIRNEADYLTKEQRLVGLKLSCARASTSRRASASSTCARTARKRAPSSSAPS